MNKNQLVLTVHSFVDLITNSSTEIFVQSNEKTIQSLKEIVDTLFKLTGSDLRFDDVFEANLVIERYDDEKDDWVRAPIEGKADDYEYTDRIYLSVSNKVKDDALAEKAAKMLENIKDIFEAQDVTC